MCDTPIAADYFHLPCRAGNRRNVKRKNIALSSAFAAQLAKELPLNEAARAAKEYINQAITHGAAYTIGNGHGPVHHFYNLTVEQKH